MAHGTHGHGTGGTLRGASFGGATHAVRALAGQARDARGTLLGASFGGATPETGVAVVLFRVHPKRASSPKP